jgi:hypothetical protein
MTFDCADPAGAGPRMSFLRAFGEVAIDGRPDRVVMADPEGNEFCVL